MRMLIRAATVASLLLSVACTTSQTAVPPLAGPSEFALSLRVTATPDSLVQDGSSASIIQVLARDANNQAVAGRDFRIDMATDPTPTCGTQIGNLLVCLQDFGTLSTRKVTTDSNGAAKVVYTAPGASPLTGEPTTVTIVAAPFGTDFQAANAQMATIRLIPPGVILPSPDRPRARFTYAKPVNLNVPALFDASSSCPRGIDASGACLPPTNQGATITNYSWSFGDGGTATGQIATHTFSKVGTVNVTLTVTNDRGAQDQLTQQVTVDVTAPPSGDIVVSPTTPVVGDRVLFNADSIQAAPGHSISQYSWDFGDPNPGPGNSNNASGSSVSHVYNSPGAFNIVLTVTDDTGQRKTFTKSITVGSGQPKAAFTFAITNALTDTVQVDASGSTAAGTASIVSYSWNWGDGSAPGSGQVASHSYGGPGQVTITLTVTDSLGRVGTASQSVTLP